MTKRDIGGNVPPIGDMPDFYYREENLDGTQGMVDSGIQLLSGEYSEWTLFCYVDDFPSTISPKSSNTKCLFCGNFSISAAVRQVYGRGYEIRLLQSQGTYVLNKVTKHFYRGESGSNLTGYACPFAIRVKGNYWYYSVDGETWNWSGSANEVASNGNLTIGNATSVPAVDGVLEVAAWTNGDVDIKSYFDKYL